MHDAVPQLPRSSFAGLVRRALREDLGPGDVTSEALIPADLTGVARLEAREPLVVCGMQVAEHVFRRCDVTLEILAPDGSELEPGDVAARVSGNARGILAGERVALNFVQHLSGIATTTRAYRRAVEDTAARIVDTRKTTPGWRALEKYAVRCGGGVNHRAGLFDGVLIKDNHIAAVGSIGDAVKRARERGPAGLRVQVEVESLAGASEALEAGAEALLIDNQPVASLRAIVEAVAGRVPTEATGGVTLEGVAEIARTGVDRISIGALTHSAPAVDLALEWDSTSTS